MYLVQNNNSDTILILGSQSTIKIQAVKNVFANYNIKIIAVKAESNVNQQPVGEETRIGAYNRLQSAKDIYLQHQEINKNYIYLAIENGIYADTENSQYIWQDKAIIIVKTTDNKIIEEETTAVKFPKDYVNAAMNIGFKNTTVAKEMLKARIITDANDPHLSLTGNSRQQYLEKTLTIIAKEMQSARLINSK